MGEQTTKQMAGYYGLANRSAYGYGHPLTGFHGSARLSSELGQEENFLAARRELYGQLRQAEATEQSHRAARSEQIHAAALEEYRRRDAELKAATAAAAETKALFDRAAEAARRAEEARNAEVAAAEKKAKDAREAEAALAQATSVEAKTADTLSRLQADHRNTQIYNAGYGYAGRAF